MGEKRVCVCMCACMRMCRHMGPELGPEQKVKREKSGNRSESATQSLRCGAWCIVLYAGVSVRLAHLVCVRSAAGLWGVGLVRWCGSGLQVGRQAGRQAGRASPGAER
jgi:hypothetical protein